MPDLKKLKGPFKCFTDATGLHCFDSAGNPVDMDKRPTKREYALAVRQSRELSLKNALEFAKAQTDDYVMVKYRWLFFAKQAISLAITLAEQANKDHPEMWTPKDHKKTIRLMKQTLKNINPKA